MLFRFPITLALALAAPPLSAQAVVQPIGVSDADALAEQVRRLGANPLDLDALLGAAELSLRLDDLSAAGSFLARADKIAPGSARGQAVRGAILVHSERPGEALAQFARAEAMGFSPARFAADRGLAYDLIGDQMRAQREYKLALREGGGSDETRRRYALSLGILGKQREALDELAPQIKRNDRAGWRTRAFVLAMGGDAAEASRIASTMMPPGSAQGLQAFFADLPRLPAIDRAFAVHFGEVRPSSSRLADARLAPQLPPLPTEAAPVQIAAVVAPAPTRDRDRRRKEKLKPGRVTLADAAPVLAAVEPVAQPPAYQAPAYQPPAYPPPRSTMASVVDRPLTPGEQASLAAATLKPSQRRGARAATALVPPAAAIVTPRAVTPVTLASATPSVSPAPTLAPSPTPLAATPVASALGIAPPIAAGSAAVASAIAPSASTISAAPPPAVAMSTPLAALVSPPVARLPGVTRTSRLPRGEADDILAKIVANLSIPASELGIEKTVPGTRTSRAAAKLATAKPGGEVAPATGKKEPVDRKAEARRLLAEKKAAADKKELAARQAAEKKAARNEPSRIWVQVAGGANEGDLGKAWSTVRTKAPDVLAGRKGYTAKLRATNRVLTGPFKSDAEARDYVGKLRKNGISAFAFTSDAGEKVSRLGDK